MAGAAILQNPRYTGYAIFGRWHKHEELLDPDDVAAGHITRFRRSPTHRIIRSKKTRSPGDRVGRTIHRSTTPAPPASRNQQPRTRSPRQNPHLIEPRIPSAGFDPV